MQPSRAGTRFLLFGPLHIRLRTANYDAGVFSRAGAPGPCGVARRAVRPYHRIFRAICIKAIK